MELHESPFYREKTSRTKLAYFDDLSAYVYFRMSIYLIHHLSNLYLMNWQSLMRFGDNSFLSLCPLRAICFFNFKQFSINCFSPWIHVHTFVDVLVQTELGE